jgi:TPR repeat protein
MRQLAWLLLAAFAASAACSSAASRPSAPPRPETPELRACLDGTLERCFDAGKQLQTDPAHQKQLLAEQTAGCERHAATDCFRAGTFSVAPEDLLDFMARACEYGMAASCRMLGGTLGRHASSHQLLQQSIGFLALGCKQEDAVSCVLLGRTYDQGGPGLARNPGRAIELYGIGCALHDAEACRARTELECRESGRTDCAKAPR